MEIVEEYKYLGVLLDNKLQWSKCSDLIYKTVSFNVDCTILTLFYKSFIESILTFCIVCWFGNATVSQRNMLRRIITTASKVLGVKQTGLNEIFKVKALRKAHKIILDPSHPLYPDCELLPSGSRYRATLCRKNRTIQ